MSKLLSRIAIGLASALLTQSAVAGGFIEIEAAFGADSNEITNAWWPLPEGTRFAYSAEAKDECLVDVVDVLPAVAQSRTHVGAVKIHLIGVGPTP
jgi:hypothetical protein